MNNDIYEIIEYLVDPDGNYEQDESDLEAELYDTYGIDVQNLEELLDDLLPLCRIEQSPLTGRMYQGFGTDSVWLYRRDITIE